MSFDDFLKNFSGLDVCRVRRGFFSNSFKVQIPASLGISSKGRSPLQLHTLVLLPPNAEEGEPERQDVVLSFLQPSVPRSGRDPNDEKGDLYAAAALELLEVMPETQSARHINSVVGGARREVSLDATVKCGRMYAVIIHWSDRRAAEMASQSTRCSLNVYSDFEATVNPFPNKGTNVEEMRAVAYKAACASNAGTLLFADCGAKVRTWRDPAGRVTAFLLSGGTSPSGLLISVDWKLKNALLQTNFPSEAPTEMDASAALSGQEYDRNFSAEVMPGEERLVLLTWLHASQPCSIRYSWSAAAAPCLACSQPVGVAVEGRFSGKFVEYRSNKEGGRGKVHSECVDKFEAGLATKCMHCSEPIMQVPGKFSGRFFQYKAGHLGAHPDGQIHEECHVEWQRSVAPKCLHCGEPVMCIEGQFTGQHYTYPPGRPPHRAHSGGQVHTKCNDAWLKK